MTVFGTIRNVVASIPKVLKAGIVVAGTTTALAGYLTSPKTNIIIENSGGFDSQIANRIQGKSHISYDNILLQINGKWRLPSFPRGETSEYIIFETSGEGKSPTLAIELYDANGEPMQDTNGELAVNDLSAKFGEYYNSLDESETDTPEKEVERFLEFFFSDASLTEGNNALRNRLMAGGIAVIALGGISFALRLTAGQIKKKRNEVDSRSVGYIKTYMH